MPYTDDDMLMLSGIQHFMFCPRQWALIHLEQQWEENRLTFEGEILHQRVDDPFYRELNNGTLTLRSVNISSRTLGLYGITDAVEMIASDSEKDAITISRYPGYWRPYPVEYKRGHSKPDERDEVQLAAQVICLEEMYNIHIPYGALYYGETRHREEITINDNLRSITSRLAEQMHRLFEKGETPPAVKRPHCRNCSLTELCMPKLKNRPPVEEYLKNALYEETA